MFKKPISLFKTLRNRDFAGELFNTLKASLTEHPSDKLLTKFTKRYVSIGIAGATTGGGIGGLFGTIWEMEKSIGAGFEDYERNTSLTRAVMTTIEAEVQGVSSFVYTGAMVGGTPITYPIMRFFRSIQPTEKVANNTPVNEVKSEENDSCRP